jgi:phosphoribosyl 1,2-cyclic phosphodiesterase
MDVSSNQQIIVRINGVLPEISTLGNENESERMADVKRIGMTANTSCSIFTKDEGGTSNEIFHMLVDIGEGVIKSIEKGTPDLESSLPVSIFNVPNVILITHAHDDHIKELPLLLDKAGYDKSTKLKVLCTQLCRDQIIRRFPHLSEANRSLFNILRSGERYNIGPFSVMPILSNHYIDNNENNNSSNSVIYLITMADRKIIIGWDFLSLDANVDQNLFWNPDLLILGTETYNHHPETGMISVTEAYDIVRRWNAKECYIVHYSGLRDFEEAKNQWFRGPTKAMTSDELQKTIDSHLRLTGNDGKFKITVAKEGMVWKTKEPQPEQEKVRYEGTPGNILEIESLQKYVLKIEKDDKNDVLKLMIEDTVNRYDLRFVRPSKDRNNNNILYAQGEKGMLTKGPELRLEIIAPESSGGEYSRATVKINVFKGKKNVFKDDILISDLVTQRLRRFIVENFRTTNAK